MVTGSTAIITTKIIYDPRPITTQIEDALLKINVMNALSKDNQIQNKTHIMVASYQGKILLTGQSTKQNFINRAKQIVKKINGVNEICDEIRINQKINSSNSFLDTWITTKIYFYLLINKFIKASNIKITTENSEVFLLGLVTRQEANIAINIANNLNDVKKVVNLFNIIK